MLDQADQCLYAAKRNGRNQVVPFDNCLAIIEDERVAESDQEVEKEFRSNEIDYSAITGLLSALSFHSSATAEHSVRVADLCVALAQPLVDHRELYRLEISALLHDVGIIGVPDSILNKSEPLTKPELEVLRRHDEIGLAIIRSAFASSEVAQTIEQHQEFAKNKFDSDCQSLQSNSISSQILAVCDAFDSMVSDTAHGPAISIHDAITKIQQLTPERFDQAVVNRLVEFTNSGCYESQQSQPNTRRIVSPADNAGEHFDALYDAISDQDHDRLHEIVASIKQDTSESKKQAVTTGFGEFGRDARNKEMNFNTLLELADEVMELCRETRSSFIASKLSMDENEQPQTSS